MVALLAITPRDGATQLVGSPPACEEGRIARIEIRNGDVFSPAPEDPRLLRWVYETANQLHIRTRRDFLRKALVFEEGDCLDPHLLAESERLLDGFSFLRSVSISHGSDGEGRETVYVDTEDEWTTQANVGVTYDDGLNLEWIGVNELNLLGHGIGLAATRHQYREDRSQSVAVTWPHLVRYASFRTHYSASSSGTSYGLRASRPFVGDVGRHSFQLSVGRSTDLFSYGTSTGSDYSHLLVPLLEESASLQYGRRFGSSRRAWVLGFRLERQALRTHGAPEYVVGGDFGESRVPTEDVPDPIQRQLLSRRATRLSLHLGTRANVPTRMVGLDGVRDVQSVANGYLVAFAVGRSLGRYVPDGVEVHDAFVHLDAAIAKPVGSSYVRAGLYLEADHAQEDWSDLMAGAEVVAYGRAPWLPNQTVFFRASGAGGWRTTVPFQLTLGGRDGVRSLRDDEWPGGRRLILTVEDRIRLDWPDWQAADVGLTVLGDVGRTWAGDAPFGVASGWQGSVGFGLRVGVPRGTRFIWRPDVVFPVGRRGSPVFRVTLELNSLRSGFATEKLLRSMRFNRGIETF